MKKNENIDKIFKDRLSDYSEKVPDFVWSNIEKTLANKKAEKRKPVFWLVAASVAILLSFGTGYWLSDNNNTTSMQIVEKQQDSRLNKTMQDSKLVKNSKKIVVNNNGQTVSSGNKNAKLKANNKKTNMQKIADANGVALAREKNKEKNKNNTVLNQEKSRNITKKNTTEIKNIETYKAHEIRELEPIQNKLTIVEQDKEIVFNINQLLPPLFAYNTDKDNETKTKNNWLVSVKATPLLSYRHVAQVSQINSYSNMVSKNNLHQNYDNEKPLLAYSGGVGVAYKMRERWLIKSGIYKSKIGQVVEDISMVALSSNFTEHGVLSNNLYAINTSVGNIVTSDNSQNIYRNIVTNFGREKHTGLDAADYKNNSGMSIDLAQTFEYYELPIIVSYKLINSKLGIYLDGGFSANLLTKNKTYLRVNKKQKDISANVDDIKKVSYVTVVGFDVEYPLFSNLIFTLNPVFKYSVNSISKTNKVYPYSFGVFTGIKFFIN